jgi:hypothetical protein
MAKEKDSENMWREHRRKRGMFGLWFGIFLLLVGVAWLGNDMKWWSFDLPWAPILVVLFALSLILSSVWRFMQ